MAENSSGKRMSISFTLPISCQICLGKVKQPIVCPNRHVFCSVCIELWLQHNQQCPTCRVPITPENPCKQIIGGQNQENEADNHMSTPALRRARFDILYQDCENEIKRLQEEKRNLQTAHGQLQEELLEARTLLADSRAFPASSAQSRPLPEEAGSKVGASADPSLPPSPRSCPSDAGPSGRSSAAGREPAGVVEEAPGRTDSALGDRATLPILRSKLKQATSTYERIKQDMQKLREKNASLSSDNRALLMENGRLKQAVNSQSPRKYERYTTMAQQSKLDQERREAALLKGALDRSDAYIEELETQLRDYRARCGPLPRKRPCRPGSPPPKARRTSAGETEDREAAPSSAGCEGPLAVGRGSDGSGDGGESDGARPRSPGGNLPVFLERGNCRVDGTNESYANVDSSRAARPQASSSSAAQRRHIGQQQLILEEEAGLKRPRTQPDWPRDRPSFAEGVSPVANTPSTSLGRLSLESAQKLPASSHPSEGPFSGAGPTVVAVPLSPPSCHRQLDFRKDPRARKEATEPSPEPSEYRGLMLDGNQMDAGPLDENATFLDMNFTLTSEFSDCAQLMREAEERVKTKRFGSIEAGLMGSTSRLKSDDKTATRYRPAASGARRDREGMGDVDQVTSSQDDRFGRQSPDHSAYPASRQSTGKPQGTRVSPYAETTQVTWSAGRLQTSEAREQQEQLLTCAGEARTLRSPGTSRESATRSDAGQFTIAPTSTAAGPGVAPVVEPRRPLSFRPTVKPALRPLGRRAERPENGSCLGGRFQQRPDSAVSAGDGPMDSGQREMIARAARPGSFEHGPGGTSEVDADRGHDAGYPASVPPGRVAIGRQDPLAGSHRRARSPGERSDDSDD